MSDTRFAFGENWSDFIELVDERRITEAERSLQSMLQLERLDGRSFLDIGCGSGLFSLAAARLGATRVHSFDYDPASVECAREVKQCFLPAAAHWQIEAGSALDRDYLLSLGEFDVVYSWGVLHHTGDMWRAMDHATLSVAGAGRLYISIYNDQGTRSVLWKRVKRTYNALPRTLRGPYIVLVMAPREMRAAAAAVVRRRFREYRTNWTNGGRRRGMSRWHDLVDWTGGYPFEFASPEAVFDFVSQRGFELRRLTTCGGGLGCNEFVFERRSALKPAPSPQLERQ